MDTTHFKAYVVEQHMNGFQGAIKEKQIEDLPPGDLLVRVHYSSLNYKDALSASGNKAVTREYPHTPGIDAVGTVVESDTNLFQPEDKVIVTSYDLGMNTDGGFAEYVRVPLEWAVKLPEGLSMQEAMIYGTAGLTAGISVLRLTELVAPEDGEILVSGATGGVGAMSIALLNTLGYNVIALTGKAAEKDYLLNLGAQDIVLRPDFENLANKPLLKPLYAGAIDTVGGTILENSIKSVKPMGTVTCCGNVASPKLELTVYPFILRGISLIGIDSQNYPMAHRKRVWKKLASDWKPSSLSDTFEEITLDELPEKINLMLKGKLKGRTIVNISKPS